MKKEINSYNFKKISSNMAKRFGTIRRGEEKLYTMTLLPMESNLVKTNRMKKINSGREAIEAIHLCLFVIDGYINKVEYNLDPYITEKNRDFFNALLTSFDPFSNAEIAKILEATHKFTISDDLEKYFTEPVQCLLRLEKSIETWTDQLGVNGYFKFLEQQLGAGIKNDGKMDFAINVDRVDIPFSGL